MTPTYRIRDWGKHFENNRTRDLKELRFVILPNKHDGDGYTELLDHPNGAAHYGAWVAMVQVASKCDPRGTLLRDGARPHDPASLSRLTRLPKAVFEEAIPRLLQVGWIEVDGVIAVLEVPVVHIDSEIPQQGAMPIAAESRTPLRKSAIEQNGIEEKRKEEKKERRSATPPDPRSNHPAIIAFREVRGRYPTKDLYDRVIEVVGAHPDLPLMQKCWVTWRESGYNSENYGWVVDWYTNGIPERHGGKNGSGQQRETASQRDLRLLKESLKQHGGSAEPDQEADSQVAPRLLSSNVGARTGRHGN